MIPLTPSQQEELDRRLDALDREGATGSTWDEAMARMRSSDEAHHHYNRPPRPTGGGLRVVTTKAAWAC